MHTILQNTIKPKQHSSANKQQKQTPIFHSSASYFFPFPHLKSPWSSLRGIWASGKLAYFSILKNFKKEGKKQRQSLGHHCNNCCNFSGKTSYQGNQSFILQTKMCYNQNLERNSSHTMGVIKDVRSYVAQKENQTRNIYLHTVQTE